MNPTLAQLESFRSLARHGSMTKVARELRMTQPAVSQHIASLQRALGLTLVEMRGRRVVLTDAGRFVAARAAHVTDAFELLRREAGEYARAQRGELHVGATLTIGTYLLPELLAGFGKDRREVVARISVINTMAVAAAVRTGEIPLGLVEGRVDDDRCAVTPFTRDRLVLAVPATGHRFSACDSVPLAALHGEAFVSRELGSGTRDLGYELLLSRGIDPTLVLELPSGEAIVRAVEARLGVAILSERVVARSLAIGTLRALDIEDVDMHRNFSLVFLRDALLPPLVEAFAVHVRNVFAV